MADIDWDTWLASKLESELKITDETFAEYITQLCTECNFSLVACNGVEQDTIEEEEKREVIVEFLGEATSDEANVEPVVDELLKRNAEFREKAAKREEEERLKALEAAKQKELEALQSNRSSKDPQHDDQSKTKKAMSSSERLARERLLAQYAYETDDIVETADGAAESVSTRKKGGERDLLAKNDNAERIRQEEQAKRAKAQADHQKKVQRDKELLEKQRLDKENQKKKTVKSEKRRM
ncbi:uncharacterized protein EV422DRAFT_569817 [Fimicolochytrium jonesii]|uniref:uncharacterized protein n=1 Tax=Fimicolochytrium jonesii TaxID=1396493 RepID=UPI0022FE70C3|nr:uncharacterized protein EV422DRAFT_569817 [Fimicolochytrium jonesii]KAI8818393.1 hypothetical protein EV422DRAFT_569817 [Fimicolochytrium jonesii]